MKPTLASRRARIARIEAKRPREHVEVVLEFAPSDDPALLRRFDRWLQRVLLAAGTPEEGR